MIDPSSGAKHAIEKLTRSPFGKVKRLPWPPTSHEADMSSVFCEIDAKHGIRCGDAANFIQHVGRKKGIIDGTEQ